MAKNLLISDDADLRAISDYIEQQRPKIPQFRGLQAKIEDFERWYQGLGWWDLHGDMTGTVSEASRRRDEINKLTQNTLPVDWVPADKIGMTPGAGSGLSGPKPPWIVLPPWFKPVALITSVAVSTLVVLKKVHLL